MNKEQLLSNCRKASLICNPESKILRDWVPECFIDSFSSLILGKIFFDVGCGAGGLVLSASRLAEISYGIDIINELDPLNWSFFDNEARECYTELISYFKDSTTNAKVKFSTNIFSADIPDADFYLLNLPKDIIIDALDLVESKKFENILILVPKWESYLDEDLNSKLLKRGYEIKTFDKICGFTRLLAFKSRHSHIRLDDIEWRID